jgi:hypothetical protein
VLRARAQRGERLILEIRFASPVIATVREQQVAQSAARIRVIWLVLDDLAERAQALFTLPGANQHLTDQRANAGVRIGVAPQ